MIQIAELKRIHLTGIKGVGMTSLALCLDDLGIKVTGSDTKEIFVTDEILVQRKIDWKVGIKAENLSPLPDLVITTGAHGGLENPEAIYAKEKDIPVITHAEALSLIAEGKETIAACGVGGKTSTASMLAVVLDSGNLHPSFAIGVGNIFPIQTPGRYDNKGKHFICEADEFAVSPGIDNRPRFSFLSPKVLIVTNIEHDHPDIYPTIADTKKTFRKFFEKIPSDGLLIACIDNPNVGDVIKDLNVPVVTYGLKGDADWQIKNVRIGNGRSKFDLVSASGKVKNIILKVPGEYNILNATAAFAAADFLVSDQEKIKNGLEDYRGCRRRFEKIGEKNGILIYDDYAHHPKEIASVLGAAREWFPEKRIIAIFQPHTYSRTKALFDKFAKAFSDADSVAFMDIYSSAREKDTLGVTSKKLAEETKKYHPDVNYTGGHAGTLRWIKKNAKPGDIIFTLGAGDIFHLHKDLI